MTFITENTVYTLVDAGDGGFFLSGNAKYCPVPTLVQLDKMPTVGDRVLFTHVTGPRKNKTTMTTRVLSVHE